MAGAQRGKEGEKNATIAGPTNQNSKTNEEKNDKSNRSKNQNS